LFLQHKACLAVKQGFPLHPAANLHFQRISKISLSHMQHICYSDLQAKLANGEIKFLIDVREPFEHEAFNIGGVLIPLAELMSRANEIPKDEPVVIYCAKGIRSQIAIQRLQQKFDNLQLINLVGGVDFLQNK
jgi:rhodanese-related sulfurtransferase